MTAPHHMPGCTVEAGCYGKDKLTAVLARKIAKRAKAGTPSPYHCEHCGWWHVGQGNRRDRRAKRPKRVNGPGR